MKIKLFLVLVIIVIWIIIFISFIIHTNLIEINQDSLLSNSKRFDIFKTDMFTSIIAENEGDIYPYSAFTYDKFYPSELGIYRRNIIKLTGLRKYDIQTVINKTLEYLNKIHKQKIELNGLIIGFMKADPLNGFEYELLFRINETYCQSVKLKRSFNQLKILPSINNGETRIINFIVPISTGEGNFKKFKRFLKFFYEIAIKQDSYKNRLTFSISYQNFSELNEFKEYIDEFSKKYNYDLINFVSQKMKGFSRSKLLDIAIKSHDSNDLLFICDIDILYNRNFLEMCRYNAARNERVFFPILYSYYNLKITKILNKMTNDEQNTKLSIDKYSGYFRDSGFGMTCLYKQDFDFVGGFDGWISKEWGGEDLFLYRKFLKTNINIFRSITPGLFHVYHPKVCNKTKLDRVQFKNCIIAKIFNEASHESFGKLYYNITNQL